MMSDQIPEKFDNFIANSQFIWFTTIRADGMPQPTPVWFVRDGATFLIYTTPGTQKVANIRANPKAALGLANDDAGDYFVVQGEAKIDLDTPPANQMPAYIQKYRESIAEIGMTPESFVQQFSLPIRVTPVHVRGDIE
ncbi:MAG: TIGR03667 family PPOX class F420-dependent oxidoreductase [Chloroflexota bacterium]